MSTSSSKRNVAVLSFLPDYGHVLPLLEIAQELKAAGYHVACYLPEECCTIANRYQLPFTSLGPCLPTDHEGTFRELSGRSDRYLICTESWDLQLKYWLPIQIALLPAVERLKASLSHERPDVLLVDSHVFGEWYLALARDLDIPLLRHYTEGTCRWSQRWYKAVNGLGEKPEFVMTLWERFHRACWSVMQNFVKLRNIRNYLLYRRTSRTMTATLESVCHSARDKRPQVVNFTTGTGVLERKYLSHLLDTSEEERLFLAPVPHGLSTALPDNLLAWFRSVEGLPVVYLSFGTMAQLNRRLVRALMEGLKRLQAAALWAMPVSQQQYLQGIDIPETVRIEAFVPQPAVLAHPAVACFVTHAGAGGVREGLMSGKPMLCIPFMWDQPYNASVVACLGAGKRIHKRQVTADRVAGNLEALLTDMAYRRRCEQLKHDLELHRMAHPAQEVLAALRGRTETDPEGCIPADIGSS